MQQKSKEKYNLKEIEERWKNYWEKNSIYKFDPKSKKPLFIVDTPPPYVSADHLHAGHIMSYTQAEFIVRYKRMRGFNVYYPMGFDDNGLPTERFIEKKYNINKSKTTKSDFIKLCLEETEVGGKSYKRLWNNLGISVDWSKTYSTISPQATKISQWSVIDLYKKGALYRSEDPILWCTSCQTALAQADLEDEEAESKMNYIKFESGSNSELIVATTRPELLPACVALYVNPEDPRYKDLIGTTATVPLFNHVVKINGSEKVDIDKGTGLMMVCTWGDQEDLDKWRHDGLETRSLIAQNGRLNELGGEYANLKVRDARDKILLDLKTRGFLLKQENITHTLNVHERCSTPIEFISSKQWFIKIADMKDTWLKYGKELKWYPKDKINDYESWVKLLKWDWCISRQRYYGVPLPIWYCSQCEEPVFAREQDLPVDPTENKPPVEKCKKCSNRQFRPESDVMDTWATSSLTPLIIKDLVKDNDNLFPATLRPNAFEIIRTWDFYTIVKSHYHFGKLPFRDVMISGHGLDEQGKKLSKRLGNYVPSDKLLDTYGADSIRYWATGAKLGQNLRFSPNEIDKGRKTVIKLWNAARFIKMSLDTNKNVQRGKLEHTDKWIINSFNETLNQATNAFEKYTYSQARDIIDDFFWSKFTDSYLELVKHRLYGDDQESSGTVKYVLTNVFLGILKLYAPILPFMTEEIYQDMFKEVGVKSIHTSNWPDTIDIPEFDSADISDFSDVINAVSEIRGYKSGNNLSQGTEIENYKLNTTINLKKYGDLLQKSMRVKKLSNK